MNTRRLWLYNMLTALLPTTKCFSLKAALLRWCGARIGVNVFINSSAVFLGNGKLEIGDDVWIGPGCMISSVGDAFVNIGSYCDLGPEVMIITGSHEIDVDGLHIAGKGISASVTIGAGCWLGARSIILPGVTLAAKTLVAAGAVVSKSSDSRNIMLAGNPAVIKKRY